jgi:MFS family permease
MIRSFAVRAGRGASRVYGPIVESLRAFKGNARTCIVVEPLWGISYNLFVPYASLYMLALGVDEKGIGLIAAVGMALQTFWSLAGGWITDRFGRRRTSLVFDSLSWSLPTLIWTFAGGFSAFFAAAVLNSLVRVVHISWSCLFIEDAAPDSRVSLYAWMAVAGTLSGFFAPIAGFLVNRYGLVPATRGLYFFAFLAMTSMFWIRNAFTKETAVGMVKMREARTRSLKESFGEYGKAIRALAGSRAAIVALALAILSNIHLMVRNSFLSVVLTKGVGFSAGLIAMFPPLASAVTMAAYFFLIPRVKNIRRALILSLGANVAGNLLIYLAPAASGGNSMWTIVAVTAGTFAVALGTGVAGPVVDAVLANSVDDATRATALSIVYTVMYGVSAPFGWIAGEVAAAGPRLPALLAALTMAGAAVLAFAVDRQRKG